MVSTPFKNISQIGNLPQIGMNMKYIWNHHLEQNKKTLQMTTFFLSDGIMHLV